MASNPRLWLNPLGFSSDDVLLPCRSPLEALAHIGRIAADALWRRAGEARLAIDYVIAKNERQGDRLFVAALASMVEIADDTRLPSEDCIRATASALDAAEAKLPARGAIARWQYDQALSAAVDRYAEAYGAPAGEYRWPEWDIARLAVHRYLRDRMAGR